MAKVPTTRRSGVNPPTLCAPDDADAEGEEAGLVAVEIAPDELLEPPLDPVELVTVILARRLLSILNQGYDHYSISNCNDERARLTYT